jgi:hypothetical protein
MRTLLIGAGAVGQVFAQHLRAAGVTVALGVRPGSEASVRDGFVLYRHGRAGLGAPQLLIDIEICAGGEAFRQRWDQVWLCTSSQDLRRPWLDDLAGAIGDATVVAIQPDLDDRAYLVARLGEERLVQGLIGFLSYQAPLPGERLAQPGVAYWLPPGLTTGFHGTPARVGPVVERLRSGGFPARVRNAIPEVSALRSATTVPVVAGLEVAGWSLEALMSGPDLAASVAASRQALAVVDAVRRTRSAARRWILRTGPARTALRLAPIFVAFDLEAYLRFHFTKTTVQTRMMLDTWITRGVESGVAIDRIEALRAALAPGDSQRGRP